MLFTKSLQETQQLAGIDGTCIGLTIIIRSIRTCTRTAIGIYIRAGITIIETDTIIRFKSQSVNDLEIKTDTQVDSITAAFSPIQMTIIQEV